MAHTPPSLRNSIEIEASNGFFRERTGLSSLFLQMAHLSVSPSKNIAFEFVSTKVVFMKFN